MALTGGPSASQGLFTSTATYPSGSGSSSLSPSAASSSSSNKTKPARDRPAAIKREQSMTIRAEDDSEARGTSVASDGGSGDGDESGRPGKKKKANRACAACQKAHLTCDDARPCTRCLKKGMGAQCTDGKRKRAKYLLDEDELEAVKAREKAEKERKDLMAASPAARPGSYKRPSASAQGPPPFVDTNGAQSPNKLPPLAGSQLFGPAGIFAGEGANPPGTNTLPTPPHAFESEATSLEYSILSAMLNGIDPSLLSGSPDQDGTYGPPYTDGQDSAMTPGVSGGLDFKNFFENSGTNLPSVGMATDQSSHWLLDVQPQNGGVWASASSSSTPFASSAAAGLNNGQSKQPPEAIGQLHAIGGNDPNATAGEVGSGGFKALEVPSPSPSLASTQRLGFDDGFANSNSPDVGGRTGSQVDVPGSQQGLPSGPANNVAVVRGGGTYNGPDLQMLEAQWRERVNQIYGSIAKPFPYTEGYHFLLKFVTEKFEKAEVLRIVRALGLFRPSLIALQMPLTEEDEIFVERSIQRTVLELEKLISFSGTPTVVWRRTCEICVVGSEFSMLTGWSRETLLGRRIYEFWDKNSTLEYWEKFASHAFENTSQSIVANVVLKRPDGSSVPCAACFSIKRNVFDLPSLVVGAFLPILSPSTS